MFALGLAPAWADPLLLDVVINGRPIGKLGEFDSRDGALYATRRELAELGLQPGPGTPDAPVALATLPGIAIRLDHPRQTIEFSAAVSALEPAQLNPAPPTSDMVVDTGWGAVVDYDVVGTFATGRSRGQALLDTRVFTPFGVANTEAILNAGPGLNQAIRLDSTYTYSDPQSLVRIRAGDVISSGLAWTRPLRLGGGQIARDFALRPDLVTIPVPTIAGQVAVPSSVDVLVNGTQLLSARADPGPFEIRRLPIVNGVNDISLVVDNALGQQVTRTVPIYTSTALLAPGLDAYSIEGGAVRLGYGITSDDYRVPAASASYRRGLTDWLTVSSHAEGSASLGMAGIGAAAAIASLAVASLAVAGSNARGGSGLLAYGAIERIGRQLSLSASAQWTDDRFRDLATLYGDPVPTRALRASIGYAIGQYGTAGIAYTRQSRSGITRRAVIGTGSASYGNYSPVAAGTLSTPAFYLPTRASLLTASYSVALGIAGASLYATAYHDFDTRSNTGALFGLTIPIGDRNSVAAAVGQADRQITSTLQASRSVIAVGDAGGQLYASKGGGSRVLADGQYKTPWSLLEASAYHAAGQTAWRGSATGAVVLAGGDVFAANAIPDSFAIVDTDGRAGVNVLSENRPVERTGASGRVLVPDLRSFEVNSISLDADGLPLDVQPGPTTKLVRPADRSGVMVHFPMRSQHVALVRLIDDAGQPLPVGTVLHLEPGGPAIPVGFGGEAFLLDVPPHAHLRADIPGRGTCQIAFDDHPLPNDIPVIDKLRCSSPR